MRTPPRLPVLCEDFFLFLTTIRRNALRVDVTAEWVRERILKLLHEIDVKAGQIGGSVYDLWKKARYPLIVTADGIIKTSGWKEASRWNLLEVELEGTAVGGERFFDLVEDPSYYANHDLVEILYTCLAIGFKGDLVDRPDVLRKTRSDLFFRLESVPRERGERLTDQAYGQTEKTAMPTLPIVRALRLTACFVGVLLIFWGASWWVYRTKIRDSTEAAARIAEKYESLPMDESR